MNIVTNKNEKMSLLLLLEDWGIRNEPLQPPWVYCGTPIGIRAVIRKERWRDDYCVSQ